MDVGQYLHRIGIGVGSVSGPDLATLRRLHRAHLQTVPFENLDIRRGHPLVLDERSLFDKIVRRRRGGICYEQNMLFCALLEAIGFSVTLVGAEVSIGESEFGPPFDHMALLVLVGQHRLLADVGFGDSFVDPLLMDHDGEQAQDTALYEVRRDDRWHVVTRRLLDESRPVTSFRFQAEPRQASDFKAMCLHHQTSPESHFTRKDICSRATDTGRITISGDHLIETRAGVKRVTELDDPEQRRRALQAHFGLSL
jgi:N-hydroxyarylamine O-acetyltransferase